MKPYFRLSIRGWLLILSLVAALPLFAFSAYSLYELGHSRQAALLTELTQRTEAAASAVEQRLNLAAGYLSTLATSDAALGDDTQALYEHALRLLPRNPDVTAITLIGPNGEQVFNTLRPFGTAHPPTGSVNAARQIFDSGRPGVSGAFVGSVSGKVVSSVGVPVVLEDRVAYALRMVLRTEAFAAVLGGQRLPAEWTAAIVDASGVFVARTHAPELFIGKPVSDSVKAALLTGLPGPFEVLTGDGTPVKMAIVRVPEWGWTVTVGVPVSVLNAPVYQSLLALGIAALLFALLGGLAAMFLVRHIGQQVSMVSAATQALKHGQALQVRDTGIRELDDLGSALGKVDERAQQTNVALADAVVANLQMTAELAEARNDALTGLPGRFLFLRQVESLRQHSPERLALLFIDLDGFKQVNDRQGHEQGDAVLCQVADILRELIRDADVPGRLGGDEFVVCITAPAAQLPETAASVARRIVERVGRIGHGIGCSIGVAIWHDDQPSLSEVMKQADEAMYEAKRLGKNRYVVHSSA